MNYFTFEELGTDKERIQALLRECNAQADQIKELKESLGAFQYWTGHSKASLLTGISSLIGHIAIVGVIVGAIIHWLS